MSELKIEAVTKTALLSALGLLFAPYCLAQRLFATSTVRTTTVNCYDSYRAAVTPGGTCYLLDATEGTLTSYSADGSISLSRSLEWSEVSAIAGTFSDNSLLRLRESRIELVRLVKSAGGKSSSVVVSTLPVTADVRVRMFAGTGSTLFLIGTGMSPNSNLTLLHIVDSRSGKFLKDDLTAFPGVGGPLRASLADRTLMGVAPGTGHVVVVTPAPYEISVYSAKGELLRRASPPGGASTFNLIKVGGGFGVTDTTGPTALAVLPDDSLMIGLHTVRMESPQDVHVLESHLELFSPDLRSSRRVVGKLPGKPLGCDRNGAVYFLHRDSTGAQLSFVKAILEDAGGA